VLSLKGIRPIEEIRELQLQRLVKNKSRTYTVESHAQEMIDLAKSKGIELQMTKYSFLYMVEVCN
jgi:hypothetical protein